MRSTRFNRGKRSVVVDLETGAGRSDLEALVAGADFLVENAGPGAMDAMGVGYEALRRTRPDLVYVAISPFGQTGPYAHHLATDLTLSAMGGSMSLIGQPDRRPARITVPQTWLHAATESALAALVAHERRLATGEAQFVDVSVQAAVFWTGLNAMISSAIDGRNIERCGTDLKLSTVQAPLVFPAADGDVCLVPRSTTLPRMIPWMVERGAVSEAWAAAEDWETWERRWLDGDAVAYTFDEVIEAVRGFTGRLTKSELFGGGLERRVTIVPVSTAADVVDMEQLFVREYWDEIALPSGRTVRAPGAFVKTTGPSVGWPDRAPALGEHDDVVVAARSATRRPAPEPTAPDRALPLAGVRVVDFSWIGVGPITGKALADHGATVVRVETDDPPDRLRLTGPFTDDVLGINRCQFYGSFNTSKLSLQLDLKHPTGNEVARELLAWCDIALDSFTAGTLGRLGLGYDVASGLNPSIVMAETCLFGQYGPISSLAGYGYHAAAVSGFYEVTGWEDRPPGGPFNAYTDTIAPRFLTTVLLAALDHRRRTGEGQYIDQAQMESSLHFLAPQLLDVQLAGRVARRAGNHDPDRFPHDAYPCLGDDQWCAIAIETAEQWRALCSLLGDPEWAVDPALDAIEARRASGDLIESKLAEFTSQREARELMDLLQAAGVPAGMVQRSSDHLVDPQLAHRGFFRPLQHPEMGEVPYEGHQYRIAGYDHGPRLPAPCLGEHSFEVLTDVLGIDVERAAEILASGACG